MGSMRREFSVGDWVIHCRYGVGQITAVEERPLYDGTKRRRRCFKVETQNGEFWFPIDNNDNPRIRSIATPNKFQRALRNLRRPPQNINAHKSEFRKKISEVRSNVSLAPMICLARDLFARNQLKKLSVDEDRALNKFTEHLIMEYAVSYGIEIGEARSKLFSMLRESDREVNEKFFFGLSGSD